MFHVIILSPCAKKKNRKQNNLRQKICIKIENFVAQFSFVANGSCPD